MQAKSEHAGSPQGLLSRRWRTLAALVAGVAVALLSLTEARTVVHETFGSDWLGLAMYVCGAVVIVAEGDRLFAQRAATRAAQRRRIAAGDREAPG